MLVCFWKKVFLKKTCRRTLNQYYGITLLPMEFADRIHFFLFENCWRLKSFISLVITANSHFLKRVVSLNFSKGQKILKIFFALKWRFHIAPFSIIFRVFKQVEKSIYIKTWQQQITILYLQKNVCSFFLW